jgi:hypothetical protein
MATTTYYIDGLLTQPSAEAARQHLQSNIVPVSAAPANPVDGQIYFDSTTLHFFGWNGTAWKQLDN